MRAERSTSTAISIRMAAEQPGSTRMLLPTVATRSPRPQHSSISRSGSSRRLIAATHPRTTATARAGHTRTRRSHARSYLLRDLFVKRLKLRLSGAARTSQKYGLKTRWHSHCRLSWFESSRFNVQMSAQNGATTRFESDRLLYDIERSRYPRRGNL